MPKKKESPRAKTARARARQVKATGPAKKLCADYGGRARGEPCQRDAGWGTGKTDGPCKDHTPESLAKAEDVKKRFLEFYEDQPVTLRAAAQKAGSSVVGIHRLRLDDAVFDAAVQAMKDASWDTRVQSIEEASIVRCSSMKANATEVIFMLTNLSPHRKDGGIIYKDRRFQTLSGPGPKGEILLAKRQVITFGGEEMEW